MNNIKNIRFKGYKGFSNNQYAEISSISNVNIIIGKNNSGKTSLLDIIEKIYDPETKIRIGIDVEDIQFDIPFSMDMINSVFSNYSKIGSWDKSKLSQYAQDKVFPVSMKASVNRLKA